MATLFSEALHWPSGQHEAIKKPINPFGSVDLAKKTYRELALLKQIRHPNVGI